MQKKKLRLTQVNCTVSHGETRSGIHFCLLQNFIPPLQVAQISTIHFCGSFCFIPGSHATSKFLVFKVGHITGAVPTTAHWLEAWPLPLAICSPRFLCCTRWPKFPQEHTSWWDRIPTAMRPYVWKLTYHWGTADTWRGVLYFSPRIWLITYLFLKFWHFCVSHSRKHGLWWLPGTARYF